MKKESRTQQNKESLSNKQPVDPRADPFARDVRGAARREEIRARTPVVSAPNQKRMKPAEAVRREALFRNRNGRSSAAGKQMKRKGEK